MSEMQDAIDRAMHAQRELMLGQLLAVPMETLRRVQEEGLRATMEVADLLRAGAERPDDMDDEEANLIMSEYPEGETFEQILARVKEAEEADIDWDTLAPFAEEEA